MKQYFKQTYYIAAGYLVWIWNIISGKTRLKAKKRLEICVKCEHNIKGICELCGCIIKAKVRVNYPEHENGISIGGCPQQKW